MRLFNKHKGTFIHHKICRVLRRMSKKYTDKHFLQRRSSIILLSIEGFTDIETGRKLGIHPNSIMKWRKRFFESLQHLDRVARKQPESLETEIRRTFSDRSRSGRKAMFGPETRAFIVGVACNTPEDHGFERSHWSLPVLRQAIVNKEIVPSISCSTIHRILKEEELRPHKNRYWLHSTEKDESPETYKRKIREINSIYFLAQMVNQYGGDSDVRIISTDEMTGIQALEHRFADKLCRPHQDAKTEFEYIRHGTTSLIGFFDVVTGRIQKPYLNSTRTADDFASALEALLDTDPDKNWIIVADNLNTHYSEQVVKLVADRCGISDVGEKGKSGPLKSAQSRMDFLTDWTHRIRFAFTPKHCSWMNQIEIWFGIINRQLLRRKSFLSVSHLEQSIITFIDQYNEMFAHPFRWTYQTTPLG